MRERNLRCMLVAGVLCLNVGCGCFYWDDGGRPAARSRSEEFGYVSGGLIAYADFSSGLTGVQPGAGYTVTIPPLLPVALVVRGVQNLAYAINALSSPGGAGDFDDWPNPFDCPGTYMCGVTQPSASPVWEASVDVTFSQSDHEDRAYGGALRHDSILLGIRAAARTPRVRGYFSTGWGWHDLDLIGGRAGARPEVDDAGGPYVGLGLEVLASRNLALGVDGKALFFSGRDTAGGRVRATARQIAVSATAYW